MFDGSAMAGVDGGGKELGAGMERRWGAGVRRSPGRSSRSPVTRGKRERESRETWGMERMFGWNGEDVWLVATIYHN